jgi:hypothetical protein
MIAQFRVNDTIDLADVADRVLPGGVLGVRMTALLLLQA